MGKRLTRVEIDSFREQGFLPGIDVFSEAECDAFRSRVEAFEQARPEAVRWAFDIKTNLLFDWVCELSRDSRLLDAIEDLIGPDILLTNSIFRIKEPGSATSGLGKASRPPVIAHFSAGDESRNLSTEAG